MCLPVKRVATWRGNIALSSSAERNDSDYRHLRIAFSFARKKKNERMQTTTQTRGDSTRLDPSALEELSQRSRPIAMSVFSSSGQKTKKKLAKNIRRSAPSSSCSWKKLLLITYSANVDVICGCFARLAIHTDRHTRTGWATTTGSCTLTLTARDSLHPTRGRRHSLYHFARVRHASVG